ncbi:MAG TPA: ABC transporter ATP-binding protein [bacterium]
MNLVEPTAQPVSAQHLSYSYRTQDAVREVSLSMMPGEFLGVIGPNGAGKSTLLRIIAGILPGYRGELSIFGLDMRGLMPRQRARYLGFVAPETHFGLNFRVLDVVAMGRYPYLGPFQPLGAGDQEAILQAVASAELEELKQRLIQTLSSGERQRAVIARALAQSAKILLLDEPTSHLDLYHQHSIMELLRALNAGGISVIIVNHDLNIASQYCDRLVLMHEGRIYKEGTPREIITEDVIQKVYNIRCVVVNHPEKKVPQVILQ